MTESARLVDLGERQIVEKLLKNRYGQLRGVPRFGDDCALVAQSRELGEGVVVATTDPCPQPMASYLGYNSLYYRGWLTAAINLSDLAAAGARPLGLLTSLILPNDMLVSDLEALLDGIDDCCHAVGTSVLGGNLKEGARIDTQATAIGICRSGAVLSRTGCRPGDAVVVVGDLGCFWGGVLAKQGGLSLTKAAEEVLMRNILTPLPKVGAGQALAAQSLLTCCMDNSDGLYPSLKQMSEINAVQLLIDFAGVSVAPEVSDVAARLSINPLRLMLGWGDWQLIGCASPQRLSELESVAREHQVPVHVIGEARPGTGVILSHAGHQGPMVPLDSQRFTRDSWFTGGIESYIEALKNGPLWVS